MGKNSKYFFCGVGGNGMSPLARLLARRGAEVWGSDRSYDQGRNQQFFAQLQQEGIRLVPQDGTAVDTSIDHFVVTRAVEESIPDVQRAKQLGVTICKRPELMADLFRASNNIAIGGTSGKSTTTAMIGYILKNAGREPVIVNGAIMLDFDSNFLEGRGDLAVFEADESDGLGDVIGLCRTSVAALTNVSLDHFELDSLQAIFAHFIRNAESGVVLNADCPISLSLRALHPHVVTFGLTEAADISARNTPLALDLPGAHNTANALAAIAACRLCGLESREASELLRGFKGIKRRLQLIGESSGVRVFDDFASNPAKISASLTAIREKAARLIAVFQPHGFQPTKMMRAGYVDCFSQLLRPGDLVLMPEIYYAGGSMNYCGERGVPLPKDISARDLIAEIHERRGNAHYFANRADIVPFLRELAKPGDAILVMGSRDETLPDFAAEILTALTGCS